MWSGIAVYGHFETWLQPVLSKRRHIFSRLHDMTLHDMISQKTITLIIYIYVYIYILPTHRDVRQISLQLLILINDQLDAQFLSYIFISILYMFRATLCSSSGESIVSIQHLVYVTLCRLPSVGKCCVRGSIQRLCAVRDYWNITSF